MTKAVTSPPPPPHFSHPHTRWSPLPYPPVCTLFPVFVLQLFTPPARKLLEASVSKAIAVDEVAPGAAASSCAEDAFFVAQRCAKRALATGHAGAASAVVNHAGNTLGVDLLEALVRKV